MRVVDGQSNKTYRVRWEIDIDANTSLQAAKRAQVMMQSKDNLATVFQVYERMEPVKMKEPPPCDATTPAAMPNAMKRVA